MKAIVYHGYDRDHIAPVMDRIPAGFQVWNIGKHAPAGYILAARVSHYNVDITTLCAVALSDHEKQIIDAAAAYDVRILRGADDRPGIGMPEVQVPRRNDIHMAE